MKTIARLGVCALAVISMSTSLAGDVTRGKEKSTVCASCHGADGNSTINTNPRLAGQYESYLLQSLRQYKSGKRKNPIMAGFVAPLSDEDMQDLAAYFASQKGLVAPEL